MVGAFLAGKIQEVTDATAIDEFLSHFRAELAVQSGQSD
jgi:hypothetical protein